MKRRQSVCAALVGLAVVGVSGGLTPPAGAAQIQLYPGLPVVARCPTQTGSGTVVQPRYSNGTLYCEYVVQEAPSCPSTHAYKAIQPGADVCFKVGKVPTGPNSFTTVHVEPVAPSCPANQLLIVDAGSPYAPPSAVDRCEGTRTVSPVLRNP